MQQVPPMLKTLENGQRCLHYTPAAGVATRGFVVITPGGPGMPMGPGAAPELSPRSGPVFSSGTTTIFSVLARRLTEEGYIVCHMSWRVARPNGTALRLPRRVRECADDIVTAAQSLRVAYDSRDAPLPVALLAHSSEGCAAAMAAAALSLTGAKGRSLGPLAGVVTLGTGLRVTDARYNYGDCDTLGCLRTYARFGMPIMLMHGLEDPTLEAEATALIYESATGPKAACLLRGCDHSFVSRFDDALSVLLHWVPGLLRRYGVLGDSRGLLHCKEADRELGLGQSVLM